MTKKFRLPVIITLAIFFTSSAFAAPKNIIFILADDLGWNDTSIFQRNQFYETPNIDELANRGMAFSQSYTNSPLCSPNRATILTGQTPAQHGILNPNLENTEVRLHPSVSAKAQADRMSVAPKTATRLDTARPTLSSILKQNQYQTAHFGKWHLGDTPYSPLEHGFDSDIPHYSGSGPTGGYLAPWSFAPHLQPQVKGEHIDIRLAQEARQWLLQAKDKGPFFLNFWAFSVHAPFNAAPETVSHFVEKRTPYNSQRSATYAAMIKQFDEAIGILWDGVVEAGIEDDTIIVFTSDNGGNMYDVLGEIHPTSNYPLRGGKATHYSGGNLVPTFIIWPGLTQPHTLSNVPIQSADFFPTLLSGLGLPWPANHDVDGHDIRPVLKGEEIDQRAIITYYPTQPTIPDWLPPSATILYDGWKLIKTFYYGENEDHYFQLFNIKEDIAEERNLAASEPEKVNELDSLLSAYFVATDTVLPLRNPNYRKGTFNYKTMGLAKAVYLLPEEKIENVLELRLQTSHSTANAGDRVNISWELINNTNNSSVSHRQFMGPQVVIDENNNNFSFTAPNVSVPQFVSFAFIIKDGEQTIRKQIGVYINPVQVPPTISVTTHNTAVQKGESITFDIFSNDENKDSLTVSVKSKDLALDETIRSGHTKYSVEIPRTLDRDSAEVTFECTDGSGVTLQSVNLTISDAPAESVEDEKTGGGSVSWVLAYLFALNVFRRLRLGKERDL